jgi:hypothetical protein
MIGKKNPAYRHGGTKMREYAIWSTMKQRCNNQNNVDYKDYGGRGIKVCDRWNDFANFIEDMGKCPSKNHSLDRIDNDSGYNPENCKWTTGKFQCNHTRKNVLITLGDVTMTVAQWSDHTGIGYTTIYNRKYRSGWDDVKTLTTPII